MLEDELFKFIKLALQMGGHQNELVDQVIEYGVQGKTGSIFKELRGTLAAGLYAVVADGAAVLDQDDNCLPTKAWSSPWVVSSSLSRMVWAVMNKVSP